MPTPSDIVTEFCALWAEPKPEQLITYFAEDAVYHNIPMPELRGREAILGYLKTIPQICDGIDFVIHHQLAESNRVMNERTDYIRRNGGRAELPVMGYFEIDDTGRIGVWRDYFDLGGITRAFSA
ncbi:nuclear transport factor 2 family protein [Nocardia sp. NPDC050406]|uniref:nuclear transport factor 2 family protein n=1 Tax=Nocardia sp. NPDC050406 TaxID=3364318 RepID=UPI003791BE8B